MVLTPKRKQGDGQRSRRASGFTMVELMLVIVIAMIFMGFAIPIARSVMIESRHRNAVVSATTAIQATRFQAIRNGFPFAIQFDPATITYQVSSRPTGAANFANVGGPIPLESAGSITINQPTRLEFAPNGTVQATVGAMNFNVSYGPRVRTITISRVGRVSVQ